MEPSHPPQVLRPTRSRSSARRSAGVLAITLLSTVVNAQPLTFTHLTGATGGTGSVDGTGSAARFNTPLGLALDGSGNLYIADWSNNTIRKVVLATGAVSTLAGLSQGNADGAGPSAQFSNPVGLAPDGAGNLFVSDSGNHTIRKIVLATGVVSTIAGLAGVSGSANGIGSNARFEGPSGLAFDGIGNLYVADLRNHTIRQIDLSTNTVSTLAGQPGVSGYIDDYGAAALFYWPQGLWCDGAGKLYLTDQNFTVRRIILATGAVTTIIGSAVPGSGSINPGPLTGDGAGVLYEGSGGTVKSIIISSGTVSTVAGVAGDSGYADGSVSVARFGILGGIAFDASGDLFVADNDSIRKVDLPSASVSTVCGLAYQFGSTDGAPGTAKFASLQGIALDGAGHIYGADTDNHTIRTIDIGTGSTSTLAGLSGVPGNGNGTTTGRFNRPQGVAADGAGNVFVADTFNHLIRKVVVATGSVSTLAGSAQGNSNGFGAAARFFFPEGIVLDGTGNLYVADSGNRTIRKIVIATGEVTTFVGAQPGFGGPTGLAFGSDGHLYVSDRSNHTIWKVDLSSGAVSPVAGLSGTSGSADGIGSGARLYYPEGVAFDGGSLWVGSWTTVRRITIDTNAVVTAGGLPGVSGTSDGTALAARFHGPQAIAADGSGKIYLADGGIRVGAPALPDRATIDSSSSTVGLLRQLDTSPQTATSWKWEVIRTEASSTVILSSTTVRNPTFTPDVPGYFVFRLTATAGTSTSITTVAVLAHAVGATASAAVTGTASICPGSSALISATLSGSAPWTLIWSDGFVQSGLNGSPATRTVSPAQTTVYAASVVADSNGLGTVSGGATITMLTPPTAVASGSATIHVGASTPLTGSGPAGSVCTWSPVLGLDNPNSCSPIASPTSTTAYSLTVQPPSGCHSENSAQAIVTVLASFVTRLYPLTPCRIFDTRDSTGPDAASPPLVAGVTRTLAIAGRCGIPPSARSLAVNVTVTGATVGGAMIVYRGDLTPAPTTSNVNFTSGITRASNGVVELSRDGAQTLKAGYAGFGGLSNYAHFILDVSGYFE